LTKAKGRNQLYGLVFDGYINIPNDGDYVFSTSSDDGSRLWIGEQLIVDNDEKHSSAKVSGAARLKKGLHKIHVRYFQIDGGELKVFMKAPGAEGSEIPAASLFN
jgi:hexosaminidase